MVNISTSSSTEDRRVDVRVNAPVNLWEKFKTMKILQMCIAIVVLLVAVCIVTVMSINPEAIESKASENNLVIIDTDAGTDDAVALLYLLKAEKLATEVNNTPIKIIGITCVQGNTIVDNVLINVFKVLDVVNRLDIPVYRGASKALTITLEQSDFFGNDGMGDVPSSFEPDPALFLKEHAANTLVRLVNENPGQITILALGPLTNIALAIRLDDEFLKKIKKLVILGGSVEGKGNIINGVEYNFYSDPESVHVVLNGTESNPHTLFLVPWEGVLVANMSMKWRKSVLGALQSPEAVFINAIEHVDTLKDKDMWQPADPIAAAVMLAEDVMVGKIVSYASTVITSGPTRGAIAIDYLNLLNARTKIDVVFDFNTKAFEESLINHFK